MWKTLSVLTLFLPLAHKIKLKFTHSVECASVTVEYRSMNGSVWKTMLIMTQIFFDTQ